MFLIIIIFKLRNWLNNYFLFKLNLHNECVKFLCKFNKILTQNQNNLFLFVFKNQNHRFPLKNSLTKNEHSSSKTPVMISVLGWSSIPLFRKPRFSSLAPMTKREICDQNKAPAHITHGSRVTYIVQSFRYLPPRKLAAEVILCISAWAVMSFSRSVRLCPLAIILLLQTITQPIGTSSSSRA